MLNLFNFKYLFLIVLFVWTASIPYKNAFYQISSFFMILMFIYYFIKNRDLHNIKEIFLLYKEIFVLFILIICSMLISTLLNLHNLEQILDIVKYFFRYGLIFFILLYFKKEELFTLESFVYCIVFSFLIVIFNGYFEYSTSYGLLSEKSNLVRLEGGMFNSNTFGFYMTLSSVFFTIMFFEKDNSFLKSFFSIILVILSMFLVLQSGSRSSWLMYFFFIIIFLFIKIKDRDNSKILILSSLLLTAGLLIIFTDTNVMNRLNKLISLNSSVRDVIWNTMIPYIQEKLFLGHGVDSFKYIVDEKIPKSAHNNLLEILFNTGLIGLILFLTVLYKVYVEIIVVNKDYLALFFAFLVVASFDHSVFTNKVFLNSIMIFSFFIFYIKLENKNLDIEKKGQINE